MNVKQHLTNFHQRIYERNFVKPISIKYALEKFSVKPISINYALEKFSVKIHLQIQCAEKKSREITLCFSEL